MKFKILTLGMLLAAASLYAGGLPVWVTNSVNVPTNLTSVNQSTNTSTAGTAFVIPQGVPFTLTFSSVDGASAAGTSNSFVGFDWTADNLNWTTGQPLKMTNTANTATNVVTTITTNLPGIYAIRVGAHTTTSLTTNTINGITEAHFQ